jgi:hypothetical protein
VQNLSLPTVIALVGVVDTHWAGKQAAVPLIPHLLASISEPTQSRACSLLPGTYSSNAIINDHGEDFARNVSKNNCCKATDSPTKAASNLGPLATGH